MKIKAASLALTIACLASCSQNATPEPFNAVRPLTGDVYTERHNVKMVCGRAHGESRGFKLLGIIPITSASESEAVDKMYENARARGAQLEGAPRHFVNTSYEESTNYFVIASRPVIRVAADLVEIQGEQTTVEEPKNQAKINLHVSADLVGGQSHTSSSTVSDDTSMPQTAPAGESFGISDILFAPFKLYGVVLDTIFGA